VRLGRNFIAGASLLLPLAACQSDRSGGGPLESASSLAGSVPSLVNVNLRDVLNDLSVRLNLDRANIPINAQIPVTIAANVCGVSINILSVSTGGQANCTAKTASPELAQVVQQQVAAGGSVGGGAQGGSTAGTSGTTTTGGAANTGAQGTNGTSTGSNAGVAPTTDATATGGTASPQTGAGTQSGQTQTPPPSDPQD